MPARRQGAEVASHPRFTRTGPSAAGARPFTPEGTTLLTTPSAPRASRLFFAGLLASMAIGAASPSAAAIVTLTFNGVANDALVATDPCGCWGNDAYGADIVGDAFQAVFTFDTSVGTRTQSGSENDLYEAGVATGDITINGHLYDVTGSS